MKKNLYLVLIIFCVCLGACQSQNIEANPYDTYPPGYGFLTTQNGAIFNESDLAKFDVVVLNSFTGDALSPKQEVAFQIYNFSRAGRS